MSGRSMKDQLGSSSQNPAGGFEGVGTSEDMLELEHVIGYTGHYWETLQAHPTEGNIYFKSMGSVVAICDVLDPHNQKFLRAHDMEISAMAVSPSGSMLASGQVRETAEETEAARHRVFLYCAYIYISFFFLSPGKK